VCEGACKFWSILSEPRQLLLWFSKFKINHTKITGQLLTLYSQKAMSSEVRNLHWWTSLISVQKWKPAKLNAGQSTYRFSGGLKMCRNVGTLSGTVFFLKQSSTGISAVTLLTASFFSFSFVLRGHRTAPRGWEKSPQLFIHFSERQSAGNRGWGS